ncbi:transposase [Rhizobium sp. BK376]|nr:transposase [Rhizobium sp. BK376]
MSTTETVDIMTLDGSGISGQLRVVKVLHNGKRRFDPVEKDRLIDAALEPGVSVAGLALAHGINANQLHNWIRLRQRQQAAKALAVMPGAPSAFVPVVEAAPTARPPAPSARPTLPRVRLKATLPNGVRLELEDADAQVLSAMIEALGRCDVPAG